jgi:hypothetical protein
MTVPFVSVEDLGVMLGQDLTGSEDLATIAIDSSCEMIRSYLGQLLNYVEDEDVVLGGSGGMALLLPQMPVINVTDVFISDVEETGYVFVPKAGTVFRENGTRWPRGVANISLTYSHGYAVVEDDVDEANGIYRMPADIRRIAMSLAQRIFVSAGTVIGQLASETISPDSYAYVLADSSSGGSSQAVITPDEMLALDFYRFAGVA